MNTQQDFFKKFDIYNITNKDEKKLIEIYSCLNELLFTKKTNLYSEILKELELNNLNETLIIGFLRLSSRLKKEIPYWDNFLTKSIKEIEQRNLNPKVLLRGLY